MKKLINRRQSIQKSSAIMALGLFPESTTRISENDRKLKIIVTGAHHDDPETGCGGTIAKFSDQGHTVTVAYLTRGEAGIPGVNHESAAKTRTLESQKACEILQAKPVYLGQTDGETFVSADAYNQMYKFLSDEKPDYVFIQWPIDTHPDHRICSILTYSAWQRMDTKPGLFFYEVMSGIQTQNFKPDVYVDISNFIEIKHQACFMHTSQHLKEEYQNSHGKMEEFRGMEFGTKYAEAFVSHDHNKNFIF